MGITSQNVCVGGCSWNRIVEFFPLTVLFSGQNVDSSTRNALALGYAVLSTLFTWPSLLLKQPRQLG